MASSPRPPARTFSSIAEACFDLASELCGGAGSPAALRNRAVAQTPRHDAPALAPC